MQFRILRDMAWLLAQSVGRQRRLTDSRRGLCAVGVRIYMGGWLDRVWYLRRGDCPVDLLLITLDYFIYKKIRIWHKRGTNRYT